MGQLYLEKTLLPWVDVTKPGRREEIEKLLEQYPTNPQLENQLEKSLVDASNNRLKIIAIHRAAKEMTPGPDRDAVMAALPPIPPEVEWPDSPIDEDESFENAHVQSFWYCYIDLREWIEPGLQDEEEGDEFWFICNGQFLYVSMFYETPEPSGIVGEMMLDFDRMGSGTGQEQSLALLSKWYEEDYGKPFAKAAETTTNTEGE